MSKTFVVILGAIALIGVLVWFSPCHKGMRYAGQGMMGGKGRMCCQTLNQGPMGSMPGPGMPERMDLRVLPAADGGLFVVTGNRIIKYNSDLEVVKETEISGNMNMMGQGRMGMKKGCPMMKGGMPAEGMGSPEAGSVNK